VGEEEAPLGFIAKAKLHGVDSLLGKFSPLPEGFDRCLTHMTVDSIKDGVVICSLPVTKELANAYGTLHGGVTATLVDVVGTLALLSADPKRAGVSVDLNLSYLKPAKIGETVICTGTILKAGRSLGFAHVDVHRKSDGAAVATGRHTKFL
jgi:acyl-coenzyme A thioesterase 13